jgi:hypothetical protein
MLIMINALMGIGMQAGSPSVSSAAPAAPSTVTSGPAPVAPLPGTSVQDLDGTTSRTAARIDRTADQYDSQSTTRSLSVPGGGRLSARGGRNQGSGRIDQRQ